VSVPLFLFMYSTCKTDLGKEKEIGIETGLSWEGDRSKEKQLNLEFIVPKYYLSESNMLIYVK